MIWTSTENIVVDREHVRLPKLRGKYDTAVQYIIIITDVEPMLLPVHELMESVSNISLSKLRGKILYTALITMLLIYQIFILEAMFLLIGNFYICSTQFVG